VRLVHLSSSFQKTRMEIEDISWIGLSTGWSSQQEWHLSVGDGLLWKIIIDDQGVHTIISEVFSNSASWIRSQELKWSSFWCSSSNDDCVFKCVVIFQDFHDVGNSRSLLSNSHVDTVELLWLIWVAIKEGALLVDDSINCNSSFTCLSISNNQFSLTSSNWYLNYN